MFDPTVPTVWGTVMGWIWAEFPVLEEGVAGAAVTAVVAFIAPAACVMVGDELEAIVAAPLNWTKFPPILKTKNKGNKLILTNFKNKHCL